MPRRKKKLLFDVFDSVQPPGKKRSARSSSSVRPRPAKKAAKTKSKSGAKTPASEVEVRVSMGMLGALGVVFCAFLGLAYWFGLIHGEVSNDSKTPVKLRSTEKRASGDRDAWGRHYAVRAVELSYLPHTFEARKRQFRRLLRLLKDEGYSHIDVWDYASERRQGHGQLVIWVGRANNPDALETLARRLRPLKDGAETPFKHAFPTLFTESLSRK